MPSYENCIEAARIVEDAGGRIVGRVRLQKTAYLLTATGLEKDFRFAYKHYGPFSETLANAAHIADLLDYLKEEERVTNWGAYYSIYETGDKLPETERNDDKHIVDLRKQVAGIAAKADSFELELAATALFLAKEEKCANPWEETEKRKPEKAHKIEGAKQLYQKFLAFDGLPEPLPDLA